VVVAGLLALSSVAVVAATANRADLARDDWRVVADRLATRGAKVVVVAPPYERAPLEYYRPGVSRLGPRQVSVREIVLVGYPLEDVGFPPRWFEVPSGFRIVESRLFDRIRLVRFRSPDAVPIDANDVGRPAPTSAALFLDRGSE
jgi:hypothetical protein